MIKYLPFPASAFANRLSKPNPKGRVRPLTDQATRPHRDIGPIGTAARLLVGLLLVGLIAYWLLRRHDQIACAVFTPLDSLES